MSESDDDENQPGFEAYLQHLKKFVEEHPDEVDAQSHLEFAESMQALTCTFCLGRYHTVQTGCGTLNVLLERLPGGSQNPEWFYLRPMIMNGQMSYPELLVFISRISGKVVDDE